MSEFILSDDPPDDFETACRADDRLFHSPDWQGLLEQSFGARSIYAWDDNAGCGAAVTVFRAGPFQVGYIGFPVGGAVGGPGDLAALVRTWRDQTAVPVPVCVRIPISSSSDQAHPDLPCVETPETAILDLPSWSLGSTSSNIRRDLKKAEGAGLEVSDVVDVAAAARMFGLYQATIDRQRGSMRYSRRYFERLAGLAGEDDRLRVTVARQADRIVAFNVAARDGTTGYYLHGGIDWSARDLRPGTLLMRNAIEWAQTAGCTSFDLMSSPPGQASLTQYKEKWGGATRIHRTYTQALKSTYSLFKLAERAYRLLR